MKTGPIRQIKYSDKVLSYRNVPQHAKPPLGKCGDCGDPFRDTDRVYSEPQGRGKNPIKFCSHIWCWGKKFPNRDAFQKDCFVEYEIDHHESRSSPWRPERQAKYYEPMRIFEPEHKSSAKTKFLFPTLVLLAAMAVGAAHYLCLQERSVDWLNMK